ncbi:MAG TPA: energy transducer TonB [Verrucomicrobiae bacterium]|nr:energy transducer TonB [Verrucomicrobiae bacterium]
MRRVPKLSFAQGQLLLWILAGSMVAFGAMILFLRFSGVSLTTAHRDVTQFNFMPTTQQDKLLVPSTAYLLADVNDPSLMSLPSTHGFSRRAWSRKIEASQRQMGWDEPVAFLGVTPPSTPRSLLQPMPPDEAVVTAARKTAALSEEPGDQEALEPPISINQSVFRLLGGVGDRRITYAPALPAMNSTVPPTQVRVGVDAGGLVLYALLNQSSGDDSVDAKALELARQFRFEAAGDANAAPLSWGVLRFMWATQPVSATNTESVAAQH